MRAVFSVSEDGALVPVRNPDPQKLSELYGYEAERRDILLNTKAMLAGRPANNVLLYGDAATDPELPLPEDVIAMFTNVP